MTTPAPDRTAVEARLERLERDLRTEKRRNRWLLAAGGLAAVGCFLAWIVGNTATTAQAQGPKVIRANQFVLEDETGTTRAMLTVDKAGAGLFLSDENGKFRVHLIADKDRAGLILSDENDNPRVGLAMDKDGPRLCLDDQNGKCRAALHMTKDGPRFRLLDENEKHRVGLAVSKYGPGLVLSDESGKTIWSQP